MGWRGKNCVLYVAWVVLFMGSSASAWGQCLVVTPTGSGAKTGTDWNNALSGLPAAAAFVRGETYYLADGKYPPQTFATPDRGDHRQITIKKAVATDHCTDSGWNAATMGSAQAIFRSGTYGELSFTTSYWTLDGNGRTRVNSGYGIVVDGTGVGGRFAWHINISGQSGMVIRYVEVAGPGDAANLGTPDQEVRMIGSINPLIEYCWLHDASDNAIEAGAGARGILVQYTLLQHNGSSPKYHGQLWGDFASPTAGGSSNVIIRYNWFLDGQGTAFIASVNSGARAGRVLNWAVYGNVFSYTPGNPYSRQGVGDGIFACLNGNNCDGISFYNNTVANIGGNGATGNVGINWLNHSSGSVIIQNNLWYNNRLNVNHTLTKASTEDYNTFLSNPRGQGGRGRHDYNRISRAKDPFVNDLAGDYRLTGAATRRFHLADGLALTGNLPVGCAAGINCFNIDPNGSVRGSAGVWSRGAYEVPALPAAPTKLRAVGTN